MAATYYYQLYIGNTTPARATLGTIWIKPDTNTIYMKIGADWLEIAAAGAITNFNTGYYWYEQKAQATEPTAKLGQVWLNTLSGQCLIYTNEWTVLTGG